MVFYDFRDGVNYACNLALLGSDFPADGYDNLIEATKKICGTSYGLILRHGRIMDGHADKFSEFAIVDAR